MRLQQAELQRQRPAGADDRVHTGRVRLEHAADLRSGLPLLGGGDAGESEAPDEAIDDKAVRANQLADPSQRHASRHLQLPETVLGMGEAQGEDGVLHRFRVDVGHSDRVPGDRDRGCEAWRHEGSPGAWERGAEQPAAREQQREGAAERERGRGDGGEDDGGQNVVLQCSEGG